MQTVWMHSEQGKEMRARLAQARRTKGWTQADVARELGVSRQTVSHWEKGDTEAGWVDLARMCTLYGVSADQILYGLDTVSFAAQASGLSWLATKPVPKLSQARPTTGGLAEFDAAPSGFDTL